MLKYQTIYINNINMSIVHKYNGLLNQAKKLVKLHNDELENNDICSNTAKQIFDIYREIDGLRDKEKKKYCEDLLDDENLGTMIENILNDIVLFTTTKMKKIKREMMLALENDIMNYIEKDVHEVNEYQQDRTEKMISLHKTTRFVFGSFKSYVIEKPVIYKCPHDIYCKIFNIIKAKEKPDNLEFKINDITTNLRLRTEITKMIEKISS